MTEIVREKLSVFFSIQTKAAKIVVSVFFIAGIERETFADGGDVFGKDQPWMGLEFHIQTNIFFCSVIVGFKGMTAKVHRSLSVDLQKGFQPSAMVIMTVGEDGNVHSSQINIQFPGIFGKKSGLAHVKKQLVIERFDIQRQAVFCTQILPAGSIFS